MSRSCPSANTNGTSRSMTGLMNTGPFQAQKESPKTPGSSEPESPTGRRSRRRLARRMSLTSANGQTIQLTPLWEHVVRTRRFPAEIDTRLTFLEISERLRDPEWEVRQHALRVLMDVLPTLKPDVVDKVMQPVVPELINNLGHPAPAVRKGALDTLRVYLVHSREREELAKNILQDGLNRSEAQDPHQTNITTGVILSAPSLLFPSSSSPTPNTQLIRDTTIALASRLAQVPHQEAVLKSLMKIRDAVGDEAFDGYLAEYDAKLRKNIEILAKIYNIKPSRRSRKRRRISDKSPEDKGTKEIQSDPKWDSDSDTSGIAEEEEEAMNVTPLMPGARVVLETEIKFNEETAITMTILEEKAEVSGDEQDEESGTDLRNDTNDLLDRRKTPRRVHFGGEIVKLRTPDSDETESLEATPKTRIPLPVSPATRMPEHRRPSSQPCSPYLEKRRPRRPRSVSSSPRREFYTHNADLSPKKSILLRTGSPVFTVNEQTGLKKRRNSARMEGTDSSLDLIKHSEEVGRVKVVESFVDQTESKKEEVVLLGRGVEPAREEVVQPEVKEVSDSGKSEDVSVVRESAFEVLPVEDSERTGGDLVDPEGNKDPVERIEIDPGEKSEKPEESLEVARDEKATVPEVANTGDDTNRGSTENGAGDRAVLANDRGTERNGSRKEPSWEELGLVGQEVLDDLHNKDDWRARVRGFERVASALRTTSALIAIEPRLGSLLHAVLGCERSCRVAAAGLAVAKVVVAGVSEEALRKRLPQLAWGLARQGGPSAAQLARIAMLRLRPALMLEQLLQPQCLNARNAKTRENALQLLIFSLVTFPSTEFKVETVASKVARLVPDRRRRVRQAALDTLAVLAQIYDPEEVLAAGRRAAEGRHDGKAMISAIRARLARKSLPLVSADGLVVYGLQISPTVQIATGPDVDWIVAGSGSVSPGTGRTRGQIIASTKPERSRVVREGVSKSRENRWIERPNFVALGVGLRSKLDRPMAWQIFPAKTQEEEATRQDRNAELCDEKNSNPRVPGRVCERETANRNSTQNSTDTSRGRAVEIAIERESAGKAESRIPVLSSRDRGPKSTSGQDRPSLDPIVAAGSRRRTKEARQMIFTQETDQQYGMHQRRRKAQQPSTSGVVQAPAQIFDQSMDPRYSGCRTGRSPSNNTEDIRDHPLRAYQRYVERGKVPSGGRSRDFRSSSVERRQQNLPNPLYSSIQRDERFLDENSCRPLQTAPTPLTSVFDEEEDEDYSSRARIYQRTMDSSARKPETDVPTEPRPEFPSIRAETPHRRRLRSLSPSQLYRRRHVLRMPTNEFHAVSMFDIDKAVNEAEYNERNKHHFLPDPSYQNDALSQARFEDVREHPVLDSDELSRINRVPVNDQPVPRQDYSDSRSTTPQSQDEEAAFDVITGRNSPDARETVDVFLDPLGEKVENILEDSNSKDWSSEDDTRLRDECHDGFGSIKTETGSESTDYGPCERRRSTVSVVSTERILGTEVLHPGSSPRYSGKDLFERNSPSRVLGSPLEPLDTDQPIEPVDVVIAKSPARSGSRGSPRKLSFEDETKDSAEEKVVISSVPHEEPARFETLDQADMENQPAIVIASRPHSRQNENYTRNSLEIDPSFDEVDDARSFQDDRKTNDVLDDEQNRDSASETNTEPAILKIESHPSDAISPPRRISRVSRAGVGRLVRPSASKGSSERAEKPKPMVQQCFAQLENKDWETTLKGLKTLSQIAKQNPEQLDLYAAGTIGRVLGCHVKNLRSQVARAACAAAGDIFGSKIRGIDQDIEDIAGPLLHRTADTNRFLRADSNAALDQMVEHLPPQKTIGVIVHRGANHQNAIVRAATARLLSSIVDRLGPEQTMLLQKDVREKLLNTGARLLIDGNLDARNHAKKMFRRLTRCEGFRRALTEAVPETTLRHIDKALKSL